MNRRGLLRGLLGLPLAGVAIKKELEKPVVFDEPESVTVSAPVSPAMNRYSVEIEQTYRDYVRTSKRS